MLLLSTILRGKFVICDYDLSNPCITCRVRIVNEDNLKRIYFSEIFDKGKTSNFSFEKGNLLFDYGVLRKDLDIEEILEPILITSRGCTLSKEIMDLAKKGFTYKNNSLYNLNFSLNTGSLYIPYKTDEDNWKTFNLTRYLDSSEIGIEKMECVNPLTNEVTSSSCDVVSELLEEDLGVVFNHNIIGYLLLIHEKCRLLDSIISALNSFLSGKTTSSDRDTYEAKANYNRIRIIYHKGLTVPRLKSIFEASNFGELYEFDKITLDSLTADPIISNYVINSFNYYRKNGDFNYSYRKVCLITKLWLNEFTYLLNKNSGMIDVITKAETSFMTYIIKKGV